jgi:GTP-binding protein HflX
LVAAFRATLEELSEADLLLHIVDITHENAPEQTQTVDEFLDELGLGNKPRIMVINKIDLLDEGMKGEEWASYCAARFGNGSQAIVSISAAKGWGIERMLKVTSEMLSKVTLSLERR